MTCVQTRPLAGARRHWRSSCPRRRCEGATRLAGQDTSFAAPPPGRARRSVVRAPGCWGLRAERGAPARCHSPAPQAEAGRGRPGQAMQQRAPPFSDAPRARLGEPGGAGAASCCCSAEIRAPRHAPPGKVLCAWSPTGRAARWGRRGGGCCGAVPPWRAGGCEGSPWRPGRRAPRT